MQRSGTEAIRTKIQPSNQNGKYLIEKKRTNGQPSEQLFPKSTNFKAKLKIFQVNFQTISQWGVFNPSFFTLHVDTLQIK